MDSLNRIFASINEAKKKKKGMVGSTPKGKANRYDHDSFGMQAESKKAKGLIGKQHKLDRNKNGRLDKEDFKMLRGESSEIVTVLSILKEAYQDELISEEAFLAIADPIMRSLLEGRSVTFPDTYEMEDLDDAEKEEQAKPKDTIKKRMKRRK